MRVGFWHFPTGAGLRVGLLLFLVLVAAPVGAAEWEFFDRNHNVSPHYDHLVYGLRTGIIRPGDRVVFGDTAFRYDGYLGNGSNTAVFAIREPDGSRRAVRIPLEWGPHPRVTESTYGDLITEFVDTYPLLKSRGLPVVEVDVVRSRPPYFAVVEWLDIQFTYEDMLYGTERFRAASAETRERARADFADFARATYAFRSIGDQLPEQVAYTPRGWRLVDWSEGNRLATHVRDATVFEADWLLFLERRGWAYASEYTPRRLPLRGVPRAAIRKAIREQRRQAGLKEEDTSLCRGALGMLARNLTRLMEF